MIFGPIACFRRSGFRISGQKQSWNLKKNRIEKIGTNFGCQDLHVVLQVPKNRKMRIQKSPNFMIFGPIACFRRSGSRFSGQKGPRSSEMRVYIGNIGHIENHQNFKILFWSRESKKTMFTIFPEFFYEKAIRKSKIVIFPEIRVSGIGPKGLLNIS